MIESMGKMPIMVNNMASQFEHIVLNLYAKTPFSIFPSNKVDVSNYS